MQQVEEILWGIVENFYRSFCLFHFEYHRYEEQVKYFSELKQVPRDKVARYLNMEEACTLLNYDQFEKLLQNHLEPLHKLSLQFTRESRKNLLEHYIEHLFYEISLLKTECYKLKLGIPRYVKNREFILEDLHLFFPLKMLHLSQLFQNTKEELEKLLGSYRESKILIRSLFFFGEELIGPAYDRGFSLFLEKIYTDYQALEFYAKAAFSFYDSGFHNFAAQAVEKFRQFSEQSQHCIPEEWKAKLHSIWQNFTQGPGLST